MKKLFLYINPCLAGLLSLILISCSQPKKHFDERISFRRTEKIPYGTWVAYNQLPYLFPLTKIDINGTAPDRWKYSMTNEDKQALIVITPLFFADESEMKALMDFVKKGNDVFISTRELSLSAQNYLHCEIASTNFGDVTDPQKNGLEVKLELPTDPQPATFSYPGRRFDSYFFKFDTSLTYDYGSSKNENAGSRFQLTNFIRLKAGEGNIYVHLAPVCFTNYFLLYHDNINYYNDALSVIPSDRKKIVWDEYYLSKYFDYTSGGSSGSRTSPNNDRDILSALFASNSLRFALWLLVIILLLLALQEIRRKQRFIPEVAPPRNDSLEFVKTIGRLYYEKRDNRNLARKMSSYFLEHVRSRYKLATVNLDERFIKTLQMKTGQPDENIQQVVAFINGLDQAENISDKQLTEFHKQLEEFYENE